MLDDLNLVALVVAFLGAGGIGVAAREIASVVTLARSGVSAKEKQRKTDIVSARDHAIERALVAEKRADQEAAARRLLQEYASRLRRVMIENGIEAKIPRWPRQLRDFEAITDDTGPIEVLATGAGPTPASQKEIT